MPLVRPREVFHSTLSPTCKFFDRECILVVAQFGSEFRLQAVPGRVNAELQTRNYLKLTHYMHFGTSHQPEFDIVTGSICYFQSSDDILQV